MKKYIIIVAAAIAAMACSKVDVNDATPDRKITFEVASYTAQTKAHSLNSENITAFNCKAFMKGVREAPRRHRGDLRRQHL